MPLVIYQGRRDINLEIYGNLARTLGNILAFCDNLHVSKRYAQDFLAIIILFIFREALLQLPHRLPAIYLRSVDHSRLYPLFVRLALDLRQPHTLGTVFL